MPRKKAVRQPKSELNDQSLKFEDALNKLETVVSELENGEVALDQALSLYEQGVKLSRVCQSQLKDAERQVALLVDNGDKLFKKPFGEQEDHDDLEDEEDDDLDDDDDDLDDEEDDDLDDDDDDLDDEEDEDFDDNDDDLDDEEDEDDDADDERDEKKSKNQKDLF